jgi:hypothetical protein
VLEHNHAAVGEVDLQAGGHSILRCTQHQGVTLHLTMQCAMRTQCSSNCCAADWQGIFFAGSLSDEHTLARALLKHEALQHKLARMLYLSNLDRIDRRPIIPLLPHTPA